MFHKYIKLALTGLITAWAVYDMDGSHRLKKSSCHRAPAMGGAGEIQTPPPGPPPGSSRNTRYRGLPILERI